MSKMKSVKGASKRFRVKKNGQIKRGSAFRSHILTKMSKKRQRNLRNPQTVDKSNEAAVKGMLA